MATLLFIILVVLGTIAVELCFITKTLKSILDEVKKKKMNGENRE